jgi:hypothetical protein
MALRCAWWSSLLLGACAGGPPSEPGDPPLGSLLITVTNGAALAAQGFGFRAHIDNEADRWIPATGNLVIDSISPGRHTVTLLIPPRSGFIGCWMLQSSWVSIRVYANKVARVSYKVTCIP